MAAQPSSPWPMVRTPQAISWLAPSPFPAQWGTPTCQGHCLPGPCCAVTGRSPCAKLRGRCWALLQPGSYQSGKTPGLGTGPADIGVESVLGGTARALVISKELRLFPRPEHTHTANLEQQRGQTSHPGHGNTETHRGAGMGLRLHRESGAVGQTLGFPDCSLASLHCSVAFF